MASERADRFWELASAVVSWGLVAAVVLVGAVAAITDAMDGGMDDDRPTPQAESTPASVSDYGRAMEGVVGDGYDPTYEP